MVEEESQPQQFPRKRQSPGGAERVGLSEMPAGRRPARVRALGRAGSAPVGSAPAVLLLHFILGVCEVPEVTCTVLYVIYKLPLQHKDEWTRLKVT